MPDMAMALDTPTIGLQSPLMCSPMLLPSCGAMLQPPSSGAMLLPACGPMMLPYIVHTNAAAMRQQSGIAAAFK